MITFYQVNDSGETKKVDFSDLGDFALKDECHLEGLSKDTLNFDELLDKGIYAYSDFDGTEKEDGNWPSVLTSGYVVVMVEEDSRAQRGITQMVLDNNNSSYYRRGILSETESVFEDWHSLDAGKNSITNLSLGKGSPSAIDGIWTEVSNLSYNIQLWKQINGISTMSATSDTNVIFNGIETLALSGAQTIYVRDSTGAFSKLCLDISNGGTGATTAAGARTALGAASQTDLNSLRNSVNQILPLQEVSDMNDVTGIRFFYTIQRASNAPSSTTDRFTGFSVMMGTKWGSQLALKVGSSDLYIRGKYDGAWSSWRAVQTRT